MIWIITVTSETTVTLFSIFDDPITTKGFLVARETVQFSIQFIEHSIQHLQNETELQHTFPNKVTQPPHFQLIHASFQ